MIIHKQLAAGRWFNYTLLEQLASVGMDIERAIQWKKKGNSEYSTAAFARALELLNLTMTDPKNKKGALHEVCRMREALVDHFVYNNEYNTTEESWSNYFYQFNYAAAL